MQQTSFLHSGSVIRGGKFTYTIQSVLGQGSFGITYLATIRTRLQGDLGNIETEVKVAVKEFFMHEFCSRHADGTVTEMSEGSLVSGYARKFRKEAENLARLSHPGIVRVLEVFEANNTCYYSMEYIDGGSLDAYVKQSGGLPEDEATECIRRIADALDYMHQNKMLHLDLKPLNVMRSADGSRLILIDFGLSKQYSADGNPESSTSIGLGTPGYAPLEQSKSDRDKEFAPTLDIYALGATYYKLLTGQTPPDASDVLNEGLPTDRLQQKGISQTTITTIERAMEPRKPRRIQTVGEFVGLLPSGTDEGTLPVPPKPAARPASRPQPKPKPQPHPAPTPAPKPKGFPKWLLGVLAGLVAVVAIVLFAGRNRSDGGMDPANPAVNDNVQTTAVVAQPEPAVQPAAEKPSQSAKLAAVTSTSPSAELSHPEQPEKPAVIALESIALSKTSLILEEGATSTLTVKYSPSNATDKSTTWKSTDASIAKVSAGGKVTAVKAGSAAIIATCGGKDAYCNVTVKAKEIQPSRPETVQTVEPSSAPSSTLPAPPAAPQSSPTTGTHNGHEYVDLGLSVKWSTCNVGAASPEQSGDKFAWGETSTKKEYEFDNYKYSSGFQKYTKYNTQAKYGYRLFVDGKTTLDLTDDAASTNWGANWRTPTWDEFRELLDLCSWKLTSVNSEKGYMVTSSKNGNSVFFPISGLYMINHINKRSPHNLTVLSLSVDYYGIGTATREGGSYVRPVCL